jgi:hypothetical protein
MNTLDDLIKTLDSEQPDLSVFDVAALSNAYNEARLRMKLCKPDQKKFHGVLIRRILELRALRWRERSRDGLLKQIEKIRSRVKGAEYEGIYDRMYLELLEKELAACGPPAEVPGLDHEKAKGQLPGSGRGRGRVGQLKK